MSCVVYYVALFIPSDCDKDYTHLCRHSTLFYVLNDSVGLPQPIDVRVRIQTVSDGESYPRRVYVRRHATRTPSLARARWPGLPGVCPWRLRFRSLRRLGTS